MRSQVTDKATHLFLLHLLKWRHKEGKEGRREGGNEGRRGGREGGREGEMKVRMERRV